jgi:hypothetical protein
MPGDDARERRIESARALGQVLVFCRCLFECLLLRIGLPSASNGQTDAADRGFASPHVAFAEAVVPTSVSAFARQ